MSWLLKAWNAKVGYPFTGYELETRVTNAAYPKYYMENHNQEWYFFKAIDSLAQGPFWDNGHRTQKLQALRENANRVRTSLGANDLVTAERWLAHILPF